MTDCQVELGEELATLLRQMCRSVQSAALELIVMGLYQEGAISSGKAARLLSMSRTEFFQRAASRGIPSFELTRYELDAARVPIPVA